MTRKILVLATSFLNNPVTHFSGEGEAKRMLGQLAANSGGNISVIYRCERSPQEPLQAEEFKGVRAVIADLERYDQKFLSRVGGKGWRHFGIDSQIWNRL